MMEDIPVPNDIGQRNTMLDMDAPDNWYTDRTQAQEMSSSVIGAYMHA